MIKLWICQRIQLCYPSHGPSIMISSGIIISDDGTVNLRSVTWFDYKLSYVEIGMDLLSEGFKI